MSNELISVIVPVYNVENEIERCIKSICEQTYRNLEIIIVDDGSTDKSGKIIDNLANTDSRINVIHKTNGGVGSARNAGLEIANGKFLSFIDSDDYINIDMYQVLYDNLKMYDATMSVCWGKSVCDTNLADFREKYDIQNQKVRIKNNYQIFYEYYNGKTGINAENLYLNDNTLCVWNKLFCREVFSELRFPEDTFVGEDAYIYFDILKRIKKGVYTDLKFYYYYNRPNSITRTRSYSPNKIEIMLNNQLRTNFKYQNILLELGYTDLSNQSYKIELFDIISRANNYGDSIKKRKLFKSAIKKMLFSPQKPKNTLFPKDYFRLAVFLCSPLMYKKIVHFLYK